MPPLSAADQEAVVAEIRKMVRTDVDKVKDFVVVEATPERIERLYHTPEFLSQPKNIRENGLIFASRGNLLAFDKPSDVIAKVSSWFPEEIAEARAREGSRLWSGDIHLWGAHLENWEPEPVAFITLWRCMPQSAWLRPERNPFERRLADGLPMLSIGANGSGEQEHEFGHCVRNRNRDNFGMTMAQHEANVKEIRDIGDRITPILADKFAQFLAANRCKGRGPDDCVLVLRLWASLNPDDARLAAMLQKLEKAVDPDGPLPRHPNAEANPWQTPRTGGQERYDEGLRKLAYLRAKLQSVLNAPQAWPSDVLQTTFRQMTRLRLLFANPYVGRWDAYQVGSHNRAIDPWRVLMSVPAMVPTVRSAVLDELWRIDPATDCEVFEQWLENDGPVLEATFALQRLIAKQPLRCAYPDLGWLRAGETAEARNLRERYLALAENSGLLRDNLLVAFTNQGESCFAEASDNEPSWVRELCKIWVSEPQYVGFTLERSELSLDASGQFIVTEHSPPDPIFSDPVTEAQDEWLVALLADMEIAPQTLRNFAADFRERNLHVRKVRIWHQPGHINSLIELQLLGTDDGDMVFAAGPETLAAIDIPYRFFDHYGENDVVRVSDLDEDGRLELWMADAFDFSHCEGDEMDLERELDCTAKSAAMGEIQGDVLSYFVKSTAVPGVREPGAPGLPALATNAPDDEYRSCNSVLIGSVLTGRIDLDFTSDGNVIDLKCKPHPVHPEQTLVALFHYPEDAEDEKGFVFAVVDVADNTVHRTYRDTIQEDASIYVTDNSLKFDTEAYELAPGVRALGVRLRISHSPRCAEGGDSDYLRLFVENGERLELVLKDLPMTLWRIADGIPPSCSGGDTEYTVDNVTMAISVLPTVTNGWHDLEVTAYHKVQTFGASAMSPAKEVERSQVLGILRSDGRSYPKGAIQHEIWP